MRTKSRFRLPLAATLAAILLSGCAAFPSPSERPTLDDARDRASDGWEAIPAITYRSQRNGIRLMEPGRLPAELFDRPVELTMNGQFSVEDLIGLLDAVDIPVALATSELADMSVRLPRYNGALGPLLGAISSMTDISFSWVGGVLIVDKMGQYMVRIPQNEEIGQNISSALGNMGAENVSLSETAGTVSYRATRRDQKVIESYLDKLSVNTAVINLQLAVINVNLDDQRNTGFDWSALSVQAGDLDIDASAPSTPSPAPGMGGNDGDYAAGLTAGNTGGSSTSQTIVGLSSQGLSLSSVSSNLSLSAALNLLSTYGESRTMQNLTLKTLSGVPVELRSGESIPYVERVDVRITSGTDSTLGGTDTATVETGFNIELSPVFDADEEVVTVGVDMDVKSLVGFRDLSAGDQIGTLSQPQIQDQELRSIVRLDAGETVLLGGLIYESVSDNRTSLAGLEDRRVGSRNYRSDQRALFVLLRPTVTLYGQNRTEGE